MEGFKVSTSRVKNLPDKNWGLELLPRTFFGSEQFLWKSSTEALTRKNVQTMVEGRFPDGVRRVGTGASSVTYRLTDVNSLWLQKALGVENRTRESSPRAPWVLLKVPLKNEGIPWKTYAGDVMREASIQYYLGIDQQQTYIPKLYYAGFDPVHQNGVLVMEYIDGGTLLKDVTLTPQVYARVDSVFRRLWSLGFAHMDAKSDNVMVRKNGEIVLLDLASVVKLPERLRVSVEKELLRSPAPPAWKAWDLAAQSTGENVKLLNAQLKKYVGKSSAWPDWKFLSSLYKKMMKSEDTKTASPSPIAPRSTERTSTPRENPTRPQSGGGFAVRTMKPNKEARKSWVARKHGKSWSTGLIPTGGSGGGGGGGGASRRLVSSVRSGGNGGGLRVQLPGFGIGPRAPLVQKKKKKTVNFDIGSSSVRTPATRNELSKNVENNFGTALENVKKQFKNIVNMNDGKKNVTKKELTAPHVAKLAVQARLRAPTNNTQFRRNVLMFSALQASKGLKGDKAPSLKQKTTGRAPLPYLRQAEGGEELNVYLKKTIPDSLSPFEWFVSKRNERVYDAFVDAWRRKPIENARIEPQSIDVKNQLQTLSNVYNRLIVLYRANGQGISYKKEYIVYPSNWSFYPTRFGTMEYKIPEKSPPVYLLATMDGVGALRGYKYFHALFPKRKEQSR